MAKQMMLTKAILKSLPPLYAQENVKDPIAYVKFFNPCGAGTWWGMEFDGTDRFFGLTELHEKELGYFSLQELMSVRLMFGLRIERDYHFKPTPLSKIYPERYPLQTAKEEFPENMNVCGAPNTVCDGQCPDCGSASFNKKEVSNG